MKYIILFLLTVGNVFASMDSLKRAIAIVETHENKLAKSSVALSQYQITKSVWEQHSKMKWNYAWNHTNWKDVQEESERVAEKHLKWIADWLYKNDYTVNSWNIAMVWRSGIGYFKKKKFSKKRKFYAHRVENLYFHFEPFDDVTNGDGYVMHFY
jgi:hypothetical protein